MRLRLLLLVVDGLSCPCVCMCVCIFVWIAMLQLGYWESRDNWSCESTIDEEVYWTLRRPRLILPRMKLVSIPSVPSHSPSLSLCLCLCNCTVEFACQLTVCLPIVWSPHSTIDLSFWKFESTASKRFVRSTGETMMSLTGGGSTIFSPSLPSSSATSISSQSTLSSTELSGALIVGRWGTLWAAREPQIGYTLALYRFPPHY